MNLPGLCLFYGGMLDVKNVVSMFATCTAVQCAGTLLWFVIITASACQPQLNHVHHRLQLGCGQQLLRRRHGHALQALW